MDAKLSPAAKKLMKKLFKKSEASGKDHYIPDLN